MKGSLTILVALGALLGTARATSWNMQINSTIDLPQDDEETGSEADTCDSYANKFTMVMPRVDSECPHGWTQAGGGDWPWVNMLELRNNGQASAPAPEFVCYNSLSWWKNGVPTENFLTTNTFKGNNKHTFLCNPEQIYHLCAIEPAAATWGAAAAQQICFGYLPPWNCGDMVCQSYIAPRGAAVFFDPRSYNPANTMRVKACDHPWMGGCSGNGRCNVQYVEEYVESHECTCEPGWKGPLCAERDCGIDKYDLDNVQWGYCQANGTRVGLAPPKDGNDCPPTEVDEECTYPACGLNYTYYHVNASYPKWTKCLGDCEPGENMRTRRIEPHANVSYACAATWQFDYTCTPDHCKNGRAKWTEPEKYAFGIALATMGALLITWLMLACYIGWVKDSEKDQSYFGSGGPNSGDVKHPGNQGSARGLRARRGPHRV